VTAKTPPPIVAWSRRAISDAFRPFTAGRIATYSGAAPEVRIRRRTSPASIVVASGEPWATYTGSCFKARTIRP
jgi:hypothetical protein